MAKNAGKKDKKMTKKCTKKCATAKKSVETKPCCKKAAAKDTVFTVHAPKGKKVFLAGEFNNWNPEAKKMAFKAASGTYTATVKLAKGTYQYKFVIDGVWCADPENINSVPNDQGTFNSVIEVK